MASHYIIPGQVHSIITSKHVRKVNFQFKKKRGASIVCFCQNVHRSDSALVPNKITDNWNIIRSDSRLAPSQWEMVLLCNDVSHWLGANLESALIMLRKQQVNIQEMSSDWLLPVFCSPSHAGHNTLLFDCCDARLQYLHCWCAADITVLYKAIKM